MHRQILGGVFGMIFGVMLGIIIGFCIWGDAHLWGPPPACPDGTPTDTTGCCGDEVYTYMGDLGFNCCPPDGGNCFPPIK